MGKSRLILELGKGRSLVGDTRLLAHPRRGHETPQPERIARVDREVHIDRIDLLDDDDGGRHRCVLADHVADIDQMLPEKAVEGRRDRGVLKVQLGEGDIRQILLHFGEILLHGVLGSRVLLDHLQLPVVLRGRVGQLGLIEIQVLDVLILLDLEERGPFLDVGTILKIQGIQITRDPGDIGDTLKRADRAGEVDVLGDLGRPGVGHGHLRLRRFGRFLLPAGRRKNGQKRDVPDEEKAEDRCRVHELVLTLRRFGKEGRPFGSRTGRSSGATEGRCRAGFII